MNEKKYTLSLVFYTPLLLTAMLFLLPAVVAAQFDGGKGTEEDPYQIATLEQLQAIADSANLDKHFIQVADIDATETENWNDGKGFEPIPFFSGVFDGNGYVISNLAINRPDEDRVGLFGGISYKGEILRVGLENAEISGKNFVGTIAGDNSGGFIHSSFATGKVSGKEYVGGLVGLFTWKHGSGDIISSYAHVNTSGNRLVGGVVGSHDAVMLAKGNQSPEAWSTQINKTAYGSGNNVEYLYAMHELYASGPVSGEEKVGGLAGEAGGGFNASYWDVETTGQSEGVGSGSSDGFQGLTTDQMTGQEAYIHMYELDFDQTWQLTEGYPVLAWQEPDDAVDQPEVPIVRVAPKEEEYDYGEVETDTTETRSFTISNTGNEAMSGNVSLTDTHGGVFEIIGGKGEYSLDPDNSMVVEVAFHPAAVDTFQTILEIHHDAPNRDDPLMLELKGTGKTHLFDGGEGTEEDPYQIATLEQLQAIADSANLDKHFIQVADIDAGETENWNDGRGFQPIGTRLESAFFGSYEGNGHVIANLTINMEDESYIGLFGSIIRGVVRHLILDNVSITGFNNVAGLAGNMRSSEIYDVHVNGIIQGAKYVGGITGMMNRGVLRQASAEYITVSGKHEFVGGLVGENYSGIISQSYAIGEVSGKDRVGGLAGSFSSECYQRCEGMVFSSYAMVDVTGTQNTGGLIGFADIALPQFIGKTDASTNNFQLHNRGSNLFSPNKGESPLGYLTSEQEFTLSYTVDDQDHAISHVGVVASYSVGKVTGDENTGGVIGNNFGPAIVQASYWDMESSGQEQGYGVSDSQHSDVLMEGLTTEQMTGKQAYDHMYHLDFEHIWQLTDGYPVLQWQDPENKISVPESPRIAVEPLSKYFGYLQPDKTMNRTLMIRNNGTGQVNGEIALAENETEAFRILEGAGPFSLPEESTHLVEVEFMADRELFEESLLVIEHDIPYREAPIWISLFGAGNKPVSIDQEETTVKTIKLHQNYPNPFNPATNIGFAIPERTHVQITVYNAIGQKVATLVNEVRPAGWYEVNFDADGLSSGIYIYRLETQGRILQRQMTFVK